MRSGSGRPNHGPCSAARPRASRKFDEVNDFKLGSTAENGSARCSATSYPVTRVDADASRMIMPSISVRLISGGGGGSISWLGDGTDEGTGCGSSAGPGIGPKNIFLKPARGPGS